VSNVNLEYVSQLVTTLFSFKSWCCILVLYSQILTKIPYLSGV